MPAGARNKTVHASRGGLEERVDDQTSSTSAPPVLSVDVARAKRSAEIAAIDPSSPDSGRADIGQSVETANVVFPDATEPPAALEPDWPGYELRLRHHSSYYYDTIYYASPREPARPV